MKKTKLLICALALASGLGIGSAQAADVKVTMSLKSPTMTLTPKGGGDAVEVGEKSDYTYSFNASAGDYVLTAYAPDASTVTGTIEISVEDSKDVQEFIVYTIQAYASNKGWTIENGDYSINVKVYSREGKDMVTTLGNTTTAGRYSFLALNGCTYYATFVPSETRKAEGYTEVTKSATLTGEVTANIAIPLGSDFTVTVPENAYFELNQKFSHYVDFTKINPTSEEVKDGNRLITYNLSQGQVYNYRTSMEGKLTQAGKFTMEKVEENRPTLVFTQADYDAMSPKAINHSVQSNQGYETGDIFVNINEHNYLTMKSGESFKAHAMRTWELTDSQTNNYFIEPDFNYTVLDLDGKPSSGVIEIEQKEGSAWADIKAIGKGTAIVLVTYDAIAVNQYSKTVKSPYMGGEYWGAIWPENTAAYVVSVDMPETSANPNMMINEKYNVNQETGESTLKNAGKYVDAEHDVFYYLDTEDGYKYTFTPDSVAEISIAYPTIGENMATYTGFGSNGVTKNEDGSYTLLLKEGRQIVKIVGADGNATYQVLTAKTCHREYINVNRPGSKIFQPGDKVTIQYSGLRHPSNKLAGIYNMSAYITYNGIPNGTSLILGAGQYTFGSVSSAQAVTVEIKENHDINETPEIVMNEGVIQVNGFGDPIGNHRNILFSAGRNPNFTAVAHKTYFGAIPDVAIPVTATKNFDIKVTCNVEDAEIEMTYLSKKVELVDGATTGTYGAYSITAKKAGYHCYRNVFNIDDDAEGVQVFEVVMVEDANSWDGVSVKEPQEVDGVYQIAVPAELAWLAKQVNDKAEVKPSVQTADIELGGYPWTPIGTSSNTFSSTYDGQNHKITGLYINNGTSNTQGLFGCVEGKDGAPAKVSGVNVYGEVTGKRNVGGVAGELGAFAIVDRCSNHATITGTSDRIGGVVGGMFMSSDTLTNCYNTGEIISSSTRGGVVGYFRAGCVINNIYNIGKVKEGANSSACIGTNTDKSAFTNVFAIEDYDNKKGYTLVTEDQMKSGEVAYLLGEAFYQEIGVDDYPVFDGMKVGYDEANNVYYNIGKYYKITYMLDEELYKQAEYEYGAVIVAETAPEKEGHTFNGWENVPETMPAKDIEIFGNYSVNSYMLYIYLNEELVSETKIKFGAKVVVEDPIVTEGHTFDGWNEKIPETMPAHDVTIKGTISVNSYKAVFKIGEEIIDTISVLYGQPIKTPNAPEKEGYSFDGWVNVPATMPAKDIEIFGSYSINSYKLSIYLNEELYSETMIEFGAPVQVEEPTIPEGMKFDGWKNEIPETMPAHDVDIYGTYSEMSGVNTILFDNDALVTVCNVTGQVLFNNVEWQNVKDKLERGLYIINGEKYLVRK